MDTKKSLGKGVFFALVAAIISGLAIFYSKISLAKIDPLVLTTSRNFYVAVIFFTGFILFGKLNQLKKLNKSQFTKLVFVGLIGGGIPFYLFFTGLRMINAQTANLIHKTLFLWVGLLSVIFLKEKLNPIYYLSCLLVFLGTYLFANAKFSFGLGEGLILSATILWSIENIIAKKVLQDVSSELTGLFRMGIGSTLLIFLTVVSGKSKLLLGLNQTQLITIFIGGSILSFYVYFWYKALKYAPASLVTLILTFSVVVGNMLNGVFAGVKIPLKEVWSSAIIGSGILLVYIKILTSLIGQFARKDENQ